MTRFSATSCIYVQVLAGLLNTHIISSTCAGLQVRSVNQYGVYSNWSQPASIAKTPNGCGSVSSSSSLTPSLSPSAPPPSESKSTISALSYALVFISAFKSLMIAGITLGALIAVIVILFIALLLVCCCYFRHRKINLIRVLEVNGCLLHVCDRLSVSRDPMQMICLSEK